MAADEGRPARRPIPERPSIDGIEDHWIDEWEATSAYRFDRTRSRAEIFSIDTPPPTVSGALHMGSVFGYTQVDCVARFQRMRGREVFYPMGWDDNGLATERRVENFYGVRCDPSVAFDADFEPPASPGKERVAVSRPNFVELCRRLTAEDEVAFKMLWKLLGLSVDWTLEYATVSDLARRQSQRGFLRMLARGEVYTTDAPTLWDVDFRTAVSQAELEDREIAGAYHRVEFRRADGQGVVAIETTRPELLPSCVALVAHPGDARYQALFGTEVSTPLFGVRVPILSHELADPEKGSGIAMICTFGDTTDVVWWRELRLPLRALIGRDGRLMPAAFGQPGYESDDPESANAAYAQLAGKTVAQARRAIVELLGSSGALVGEPKPITHPVKFYERGERPLEVVTSRQWFVSTLEHRERLLVLGNEIDWHPSHMVQRYRSWVEGLNTDWCISRQRYFGVPFPVWYPVRDDGTTDFDAPLLSDEARLPVDPSSDAPDGFTAAQRGQPGGFVGDPDVMDTWATSSLTPQIAGRWEDDPDLFGRVFPMDVRPQGPEIIRTWLFSTVVRSQLEHGVLPWRHTMINGWVLDPDRKKMSKSSGHVSTPVELLRTIGSDGVRYWAASGRPGTDTAEDVGQMKVGRRLAVKVLNATRFVLDRLGDDELPGLAAITEPIDADLVSSLRALLDEATASFEGFDYARVLQRTEEYFWRYCDDYLELVKIRAYGGDDQARTDSARATLGLALSVLLRLLAPFLCFATEESWRWWHDTSIHLASWPAAVELDVTAPLPGVFDAASDVLAVVRRAKSAAKLSMRSRVELVSVTGSPDRLALVEAARRDLMDAGVIARLELVEGADDVEVVLADVEPST
jgi:valyl-tRNA synthetase